MPQNILVDVLQKTKLFDRLVHFEWILGLSITIPFVTLLGYNYITFTKHQTLLNKVLLSCQAIETKLHTLTDLPPPILTLLHPGTDSVVDYNTPTIKRNTSTESIHDYHII